MKDNREEQIAANEENSSSQLPKRRLQRASQHVSMITRLRATRQKVKSEQNNRRLQQCAWLPSPWVVAFAVLALVVVTIFAAWPRDSSQPAAETTTNGANAAQTTSANAASDVHASGESAAKPASGNIERANEEVQGGVKQQLTVHVVGAINKPGIVKLAPGSRIEAAIAAAGGMTGDAATEAVNLAQTLVDGQQVIVPRNGEQPGFNASGKPNTLQLLNTGSVEQLTQLPGIGPAIAERIILDRQRNGPYRELSELTRVSGIGEKLVAKLQ